MPTYLYRHTLADARRWGEMDLYRESLQANIDCRHAIEEQIRENHDGLHMKTDVSALCREYGIDRVGWVLAATVQEADWDGRYRSGNREWANGIHIEDTRRTDYRISSHPELVNGFINQYRSFLQSRNLHDRTACTEETSYTGKVLILRADVLTDRYKLGDYQYFYAVSGFGCEPDKLGTKVFGEFLKDGEETCFTRSDFHGVADESQMPEWAKERTAEIRERINNGPAEAEDASMGQTM